MPLLFSISQKTLCEEGIPVMNQVPSSMEKTIDRVRKVSSHLLHPLAVRLRIDARDYLNRLLSEYAAYYHDDRPWLSRRKRRAAAG